MCHGVGNPDGGHEVVHIGAMPILLGRVMERRVTGVFIWVVSVVVVVVVDGILVASGRR